MALSDFPQDYNEAIAVIKQLRAELKAQNQQILELQSALDEHANPAKARTGMGSPLRKMAKLVLRRGARQLATQVASIETSELFDRDYYLAQCIGRADYAEAAENPAKHYLQVGGFNGLNPSEKFDSLWYLANNNDVRVSGVNPLLHYLEHGVSEGRLPYPGAAVPVVWSEPTSANALNKRLWSGFPHLAYPALESVVERELKQSALWYLAAWDYAHGEVKNAVERVDLLGRVSSRGLGRRERIGLAKCFTHLQDAERLRTLVDDPVTGQLVGPLLPYLKANAALLEGDDNRALAALNELFVRVGLASVGKRNQGPKLTLANLAPEDNLPQPVVGAQPLISVIIPAFNAETTLPIALNSLLEQSWRNLEIIVVDDGSSDGTLEVIEAYSSRDPRVRSVPNEHNMGAYPTRNNGMRAARGEFVTVHDSDDWSHPQKLERQVLPLLHDPEKVGTVSSWVRVLDDMRSVGPWLLSSKFIEKNHSSGLLRKSVLDEIGYWDEVNVAGDSEFLWRLEAAYGHNAITHVLPNTPLSFALADDSSLTRTKATHVKTIHYGLRRIYREAARWWHKVSPSRPVLKGQGDRPFPIPVGIRRNHNARYTRVLVSNWAAAPSELAPQIERARELVAVDPGVILVHWPHYFQSPEAPIADEVFEFCSEYSIGFAHVGLSVAANEIHLLDTSILEFPPTQNVVVSEVDQVYGINGQPLEEADWLIRYFSEGGVTDSAARK